jgi:hypothetical protein
MTTMLQQIDTDRIDSVTAELQYLDPESGPSGLFVAPGGHVDAGTYRGYDVQIRDGRPIQDRFTLERNAFTLLHQTCPIEDFADAEQVDTVYKPAAAALVQETLGADLIVPMKVVFRLGTHPGGTKAQPPAAQVHTDQSPQTSHRRFEQAYREHFPDGKPWRRAVMTSFWRVINEPPQDWPLALCDFQSVDVEEGQNNPLLWVDELPADPHAEILRIETATVTGGSVFRYQPHHEWWYFSEMNRDEALLFVLNDTDQSTAWRCLHSAFRNPAVSEEHTRHSAEFRTIAFFL